MNRWSIRLNDALIEKLTDLLTDRLTDEQNAHFQTDDLTGYQTEILCTSIHFPSLGLICRPVDINAQSSVHILSTSSSERRLRKHDLSVLQLNYIPVTFAIFSICGR